MKYSKYSVIIIGSGISGLYLAQSLSKNRNVKDGILVVTKGLMNECNSSLAQGGIVGVLPELNPNDSISSHIQDTIKAGCGLNDFNAVKYVSEYSSLAIKGLMNLGVKFDKNKNGGLDFALEAAHSTGRILHTKDKTGESIENKLIETIINSNETTVYENTFALDLLKDSTSVVRGVLLMNEGGALEAALSNTVVIATGGIGQLYKKTTANKNATGDGIYLAASAGAEICDMEFIQFHPTALNVEGVDSLPLVSEAVRGEGALLVDSKNNRFAFEYDKKGELAPRDIVARAIFDKMQKGDSPVYLDITPIGIDKFKERFPAINHYLNDFDIDIEKGLIPVTPACHYLMGGIKVNLDFETNITNLYAVGEAARTGLHGANRLASNSLLECVVSAMGLYDNLCFKDLTPPRTYDDAIRIQLEKYENKEPFFTEESDKIKSKIKNIMWDCAGIIRNEELLNQGLFEILELKKTYAQDKIYSDFASYEIRNMVYVSELILKSALQRKESIGAHYRTDCITNNVKISESEIKNGKIFIK